MTPSLDSRILVVEGDITRLEMDAIVNAANETLLGGGGVDGAIHRAAGSGLLTECAKLGGCRTGQARITGGYSLPARHVIHTVGPIWAGGHGGEPDLLRSCYRESLRLAAGAELRTIAFPGISTGVYGYPRAEACDIAVGAVSGWLAANELPRTVTFCCYSAADAGLYRARLAPVSAPADDDVAVWAARAPDVPPEWFARQSTLHGVSHTRRVHIHAQRLTAELGWANPDSQLVLTAALWHDIGRTDDAVDPGHGVKSAARAEARGLTSALTPDNAEIVRFAMVRHCLPDERAEMAARRLAQPERALRILKLLKDADALDRVRLMPWEAADPAQLRFPCTAASIAFAGKLFVILP